MIKKIFLVVFVLFFLTAAGVYLWKNKTANPSIAVSEDGRVNLTIAPSAIPSGISADDITVVKADSSELFPLEKAYGQIAVYRLLPEGTTFNEPIKFSITVPDDNSDFFPNVWQIGRDGVDPVQELNIERDNDGNFRLLGNIEHFSALAVDYGPFSVLMEADLGTYKIGESFTVPVSLITAKTGQGGRTEVIDNTVTKGGEFMHGSASIIQPDKILDKPPSGTHFSTLPNATRAEGKFTCVRQGRAGIFYNIDVSVKLKYTDKGLRELIEGLELLYEAPVPENHRIFEPYFQKISHWAVNYSNVQCVEPEISDGVTTSPPTNNTMPSTPTSLPTPTPPPAIPSFAPPLAPPKSQPSSLSPPSPETFRKETMNEICLRFTDSWFIKLETLDDGCGSPTTSATDLSLVAAKITANGVSFTATFGFMILGPDYPTGDWDNFATTDSSTSYGLQLGESKDGRDFQRLSLGDFGVRGRFVADSYDEKSNMYQKVNGAYRVRYKKCVTDLLISGTGPANSTTYSGQMFSAADAKIKENVDKMKSLNTCNN